MTTRYQVVTTTAQCVALLDWFESLPKNDPARRNPAVSWLIQKIRRAQRRAKGETCQRASKA